jgi:hypothetical protein
VEPKDATKLVNTALDNLTLALKLVSEYRVENAKAMAGLQMIAHMARTGSSIKDIAKFAEQALILLGKKKA